jgi:ribosomal protein S18 acetylase RimI-like enzyme
MSVVVSEASAVTDELVDAFARLIPQLSKSNPPPTAAELQGMVEAPGTFVLVAQDGDAILGSLTLLVFRIPTGMRAWIEDVVVDGSARGKGVGEALNRHAVDIARAHGCKTVDLTSRPSREAANRLYQRLGFEARETNVYRYELE